MELDSVPKLVQAFYRLVGSASSDAALIEQGESADDVAYLMLTKGFRAAQRYLIDHGLESWWRARGPAITSGDWTGTDAADGGRSVPLSTVAPSFLRLWGDRTRKKSALVQPDGKTWGQLIDEEQSGARGNYYYLKNERLWITRSASPPGTLHVEFYESHAPITSSLDAADIDFPMDARWLGVAEAAEASTGESWFTGEELDIVRIGNRLRRERYEAKQVARRTREPRRMAPPARVASHW